MPVGEHYEAATHEILRLSRIADAGETSGLIVDGAQRILSSCDAKAAPTRFVVLSRTYHTRNYGLGRWQLMQAVHNMPVKAGFIALVLRNEYSKASVDALYPRFFAVQC